MFASEPRCIYPRNALTDVICQLRFPDIPNFSPELPAAFSAQIRPSFPHYSMRTERRPAEPGQSGDAQTLICNHQFATADRVWKINLTQHFISLSCAKYTCWEDFAGMLDKPLYTLLQLYQPVMFTRIGLRYVNIFSRRGLGLNTSRFRDLFADCYLGILSQDGISESAVTRCTVDTDFAFSDHCRGKIHAGPGLLHVPGTVDHEVKFVLDLDLSKPSPTPVQQTAQVLEQLHGHAYPIFRGAITEPLHEALSEPDRD